MMCNNVVVYVVVYVYIAYVVVYVVVYDVVTVYVVYVFAYIYVVYLFMRLLFLLCHHGSGMVILVHIVFLTHKNGQEI